MRSTRRTAAAVLIAAAFTAMGAGPALADSTSGDGGVLSGNQVHAPVSVPVNACGNAVAVLGTARAACKGDATVVNRGGGARTSGNGSIGGGNQVDAPISAPVNACGNAVAVAGQAVAACKGHARVGNQPPGHHRGHLPPPHQPPGHHHHHMPPPHQPPGHHHHHMPPPHQPPGHHHMPPPAHQPPGGGKAHQIGAPVPAHNAAQSLPFTGANTAGIAAAAAGALGLGAVAMWFARRRQRRAAN